jgi:UDP-GlcNAc:undecaprenyl-phosphate/decaprenyl-phosphate GlcNAc-1-phosphate transferase
MRPLQLLLTILTGLVVNAVLTPLIIRLAHRHEWYDEKNHRKIHTDDTPRIGGVGIFLALLAATGVTVAFAAAGVGTLPHALAADASLGDVALYFLPALLGMTFIHILGLIDDFRNLRAVLKLVIQIIAAVVVTIGPFRIEELTVPFIWYNLELGLFAYPVTILWIVAVSNALNFIDGVDGLAGGTAAIATLFFAVIGMLTGQILIALLAAGLFGSILGFLVYNRPPARIFMGDSGSYVLGFALSLFPLMLTSGSQANLNLLPAITILGVPVVDMTTSVFRRLRRGKHPFSADREHLHHKLMDVGFGTWRILVVAYSASIVLGLVGVSWYLLPANAGAAATLTSWVVVIFLMARLSRARHRKGL